MCYIFFYLHCLIHIHYLCIWFNCNSAVGIHTCNVSEAASTSRRAVSPLFPGGDQFAVTEFQMDF